MKAILAVGLVGIVAWWAVTMDATTKIMIINNAFWVMVVLGLIAIILYLIANIVKLNKHEITVYDNRQWNTDNSTHSTTNYVDVISDAPQRLGVNNQKLFALGE